MSASSADRPLPGRRVVPCTMQQLMQHGAKWPARLGLAALLAGAWADTAQAAVLGDVVASTGWIFALSALMGEAWPEQLPGAAWPLFISLALVAGLVWRRRSGWGSRVDEAIGLPGSSATRIARASTGTARTPAGPESIVLPAGLEFSVLLAELESHFFRLQRAWDAGDLHALRELTTSAMLAELSEGRAGCMRAAQVPPAAGAAQIEALQTRLLAFEETAEASLVSVEFSGAIREAAGRAEAADAAWPFREVWMLAATKHGQRAWRLARHHALL